VTTLRSNNGENVPGNFGVNNSCLTKFLATLVSLGNASKVPGNFFGITECRRSCWQLFLHSGMRAKLPATLASIRNAREVAGNFAPCELCVASWRQPSRAIRLLSVSRSSSSSPFSRPPLTADGLAQRRPFPRNGVAWRPVDRGSWAMGRCGLPSQTLWTRHGHLFGGGEFGCRWKLSCTRAHPA
jgi:hypothetical protein